MEYKKYENGVSLISFEEYEKLRQENQMLKDKNPVLNSKMVDYENLKDLNNKLSNELINIIALDNDKQLIKEYIDKFNYEKK